MSEAQSKAAALIAQMAAKRKQAEVKPVVKEAPINPLAINSSQVVPLKRAKFYSKYPGLLLTIESKTYEFKNDIFSTLNADEIATLRAFAALNPNVIYEIPEVK